jgi:hypothetical protein
MGQQEIFWREFLTAGDGSIVVGMGDTKEKAETNALSKLNAYEMTLALPDKERLKLLLTGDNLGHICPSDQEKALKLMGQILLG